MVLNDTLQARSRWLPWVIAIVAGVGASMLATRHVSGRIASAEAGLAQRYALRPVIVAAADLPVGHVVRHEDLAVRQVPVRFAPSTARGPEAAGELVGRVTLHALAPGDALVPGALQPDEWPRLASLVGADRRAITLAVDEINGFSGMLAPGNVIDLLYTPDPGAATARRAIVQPLLEGVTVLATGRSTRQSPGSARQGGIDSDYATVTLEVTPIDAQRIVLAQRTGEVTVLLRGVTAESAAALRVVDVSAIAGGAPVVRPARGIQIIVGGAAARAVQTRFAPAGEAAP
ncbi:MAG TPA: Flp pilus assembly protein CpaB [Steroidobacteraceae bacterium]|nr:Flp pilus assembly protein CpaB [Steroidobacteraceae bacterium]